MTALTRCHTCHWDMLGATHSCPPAWSVWRHADGEHSADTIHAYSPDGAAKRWIRDHDDGARVADGELHLLVCVRCTARGTEGELHTYRVSGTLEPSYSAEEVK
jgi:hypothetical protein